MGCSHWRLDGGWTPASTLTHSAVVRASFLSIRLLEVATGFPQSKESKRWRDPKMHNLRSDIAEPYSIGHAGHHWYSLGRRQKSLLILKHCSLRMWEHPRRKDHKHSVNMIASDSFALVWPLARYLGHNSYWVFASLRACVLSHVWCFETLWTVAHQAPLSMGFFRREYWSGLPFSPPRDLPDPGI